MDIKLMISIFPSLLSGAVITLQLLISSMFFGLIIGLIFAILRINKNPIINLIIAYDITPLYSFILSSDLKYFTWRKKYKQYIKIKKQPCINKRLLFSIIT